MAEVRSGIGTCLTHPAQSSSLGGTTMAHLPKSRPRPKRVEKKHFHLFSGDLIEIAAVVACELCKGREIIYDCPM